MTQGVLLDFYGTVVEDDDAVMASIVDRVAESAVRRPTRAAVAAAWGQRYEALADRPPFQRLRTIARDSLAATIADVGSSLDPDELFAEQLAFWRQPPLRPGSQSFLDALDLPVCLVSDTDRDDLDAAMAHHGLSFDAIVTSEEIGAYKPAAAMFRAGLAALGLGAADVVHIGNSITTDVRGADAAGIDAIWVNPTGRALPEGLRVRQQVTRLDAITPTEGVHT